MEFLDKKVAKATAAALNGQAIGGPKRSAYHYDLWNLKYLPKFKWDYLTEEIGARSVRVAALRIRCVAALRTAAAGGGRRSAAGVRRRAGNGRRGRRQATGGWLGASAALCSALDWVHAALALLL